MSNPISALGGASAQLQIAISEMSPQGMVSLRADLSSATVKSALSRVWGLDLPAARRVSTGADGQSLLWMSPDELLLLCPYAAAPVRAEAASAALDGVPHLAVPVSDARAVFVLEGAGLRSVLSKLSPADLRAKSLPVGEVRRTRLGQVAGAFWLTSEATAHVIAFRSVAGYVFDLLKDAANPSAPV